MKTVAIVQARMGSTRLPGKVLLPIGNSNAIQMIVNKCKAGPLIDEVIVATEPKSIKIINYCIENNIKFFIGSEENVLERVYQTAQYIRAEIIIDITADCPLIDLSDLSLYLSPLKVNAVDYVSNTIERTFPDGLDLQCYTFKALKKLQFFITKPEFYQHVGYNFTRFPTAYKLINIYAQGALNWPELRITLDTIEDYELIKNIINETDPEVTPIEIINLLKKYPKMLFVNEAIKAKEPGEL